MLREYYKELKKDQQNSAGTSSNLSNTSKNANETRYVKYLEPIFRIYNLKSNINQFIHVCKQQIEEEQHFLQN